MIFRQIFPKNLQLCHETLKYFETITQTKFKPKLIAWYLLIYMPANNRFQLILQERCISSGGPIKSNTVFGWQQNSLTSSEMLTNVEKTKNNICYYSQNSC